MKVLITGAQGQAGLELSRTAPSQAETVCLDRASLDIRDATSVARTVQSVDPDLIINAAAYTEVDKAESEPDAAYSVNAEGAANLARAAASIDCRLFHISTDFVFDGMKSSPYLPDDVTRPLGVYGASKLAGEKMVLEESRGSALIIRTGWLYSSHRQNFVKTMLRLMSERPGLKVICDQIGTPTWARTLAEAIWAACSKPKLKGIYHWSDAGVASWYDFAVAIQEEAISMGLLDQSIPIHPISTAEYPTPARRPPFSVLDKTAIWKEIEIAPKHWRVSLREMLQEMAQHPPHP